MKSFFKDFSRTIKELLINIGFFRLAANLLHPATVAVHGSKNGKKFQLFPATKSYVTVTATCN